MFMRLPFPSPASLMHGQFVGVQRGLLTRRAPAQRHAGAAPRRAVRTATTPRATKTASTTNCVTAKSASDQVGASAFRPGTFFAAAPEAGQMAAPTTRYGPGQRGAGIAGRTEPNPGPTHAMRT